MRYLRLRVIGTFPKKGVIPEDETEDSEEGELDFDAGSEYCGELDSANLEADYAKYREKLVSMITQKRIRPLDLQGNGGILGALSTYDRTQGTWPGIAGRLCTLEHPR